MLPKGIKGYAVTSILTSYNISRKTLTNQISFEILSLLTCFYRHVDLCNPDIPLGIFNPVRKVLPRGSKLFTCWTPGCIATEEKGQKGRKGEREGVREAERKGEREGDKAVV